MAITRITSPAITGLTIPNTSINNASLNSVTALPSGVGGKIINSSRALYTSGTITVNASSLADTGFDHTYTGASTSNKLLHMIQATWRKNTAGGSAGGATIYANDSAISEISSADPGGLGAWHQDGATTDIKSGTIHYMSANIASTSAIKYSLYWRGGDFQINNSSTAPIIWTILEIA